MDKCISDAAIRRAWTDMTLTSAQAGRQVGLSRVQIWVRAKALGLPARPSGRRVVFPEGELTVLWTANVLVRDIALLFDGSDSSVRQATRRIGLPPRPKVNHAPIGLACWRAATIKRANTPGMRLTADERSLLAKTRP